MNLELAIQQALDSEKPSFNSAGYQIADALASRYRYKDVLAILAAAIIQIGEVIDDLDTN